MAAEGYESGYESGMNRGYESRDRFFRPERHQEYPRSTKTACVSLRQWPRTDSCFHRVGQTAGSTPRHSALQVLASYVKLHPPATAPRMLQTTLVPGHPQDCSITPSIGDYSRTLVGDNQAAVALCTGDAGSWRTRHLRLRAFYVRLASESVLSESVLSSVCRELAYVICARWQVWWRLEHQSQKKEEPWRWTWKKERQRWPFWHAACKSEQWRRKRRKSKKKIRETTTPWSASASWWPSSRLWQSRWRQW